MYTHGLIQSSHFFLGHQIVSAYASLFLESNSMYFYYLLIGNRDQNQFCFVRSKLKCVNLYLNLEVNLWKWLSIIICLFTKEMY